MMSPTVTAWGRAPGTSGRDPGVVRPGPGRRGGRRADSDCDARSQMIDETRIPDAAAGHSTTDYQYRDRWEKLCQ